MTKANFNTFETVNHTPLRVFNRVVLMSNLLDDFGKETSAQYAGMFSEEERQQMFVMQTYIKQKGVEEARKAVTRNLSLAEEVGTDE